MPNRACLKALPGLMLVLGLTLSLSPVAGAQAGESRGREFWLTFLPNHEVIRLSVELQLTSETATDVTVEYPARAPSFSTTVALVPGTITTVRLPNAAATSWTADLVQDNAVHAWGADPFVAYLINRAPQTSDAAIAVPQSGMGYEYFVAGYPGVSVGESEFALVASEDATRVTLTPSVPLAAHPADVPFDVVLDAGEAYFLNVPRGSPDDTTGTLIVADKPIGVTNGHSCVNVPEGVDACDHIFEVAHPTSSWGLSFILLCVRDRPGGTHFRVLGSANGTTLSMDGLPIGTVDRGAVFELEFTADAHLLEASAPVFVVQYVTGVLSPGAANGDPAMGNVVPLEQFQPSYTFSTVGSDRFGSGQFDRNYALLTVETVDVPTALLNGRAINPILFLPVPGTPWSVARLLLNQGAQTTVTDSPHGLQVLGYSLFDSYLFPGGAQLADFSCSILASVDDVTICVGGEAVLDASVLQIRDCLGGVDLEWRGPGGVFLGSDPVLRVSPTETTEYELSATCIGDPDCTVVEVVTVFVDQPPEMGLPAQFDLSDCRFGLGLSWPAATFQTAAGGVYNVYRSVGAAASCADALTRPPVALGLVGTSWLDNDTVSSEHYVYVVEAEDASVPTACSPVGPALGGAVVQVCLPEIIDAGGGADPAGVGAVLRASHLGQEIELNWALARSLLPGERFLVRKVTESAADAFATVAEYDDSVRSHRETDQRSALQFFEVRVGDACGLLSADEFPGGR